MTLTRALVAIIAMSMCLVPAEMAFADPVLELPQLATASTPMNASADETAPPRRRAKAPMPKGLGTLQDYERDTESAPSPRSSAGLATTPTNQRFEGNSNNGQTLAQNVIFGALVLGLFAMELHTAHQHRHR